jgi:hypothetical protein
MSTFKYTKITSDGNVTEIDDNLTLLENQEFVGDQRSIKKNIYRMNIYGRRK